MELLLLAGRPLKGYDLMARFHPDGKPAHPPTIYRALAALETLGLVHHLPSLNAFVACRTDPEETTRIFLICEPCGSAEQVSSAVEPLFGMSSNARGFHVERVAVEIRGRCLHCRRPSSSEEA